jgi:hypothetical protein
MIFKTVCLVTQVFENQPDSSIGSFSKKTEDFPFELILIFSLFLIYLGISILGGLGFEQDNYSHVTLSQEIVGYNKIYLPFFGREYVWLPFYHYVGAFSILITGGLIPPVHTLRFVSAVSSSITLFILYKWLKQRKVSQHWRIVSILLVGLNGYWLAYSTMSMTDTFSVFLLVGWFYLTERYTTSRKTTHLIFASLFALMSVATRYEAWVFVAISGVLLFFTKSKSANFWNLKRRLSNAALFLFPSSLFVCSWLLYCFIGKGDFLYFSHDPTKFLWSSSLYFHNIELAAQRLFTCLFLTCGLFWLIPFYELFVNKDRDLFLKICIFTMVYLLFTLYQLWSGVNAGFARYWLPLLPFSAIGFGISNNSKKTWHSWVACSLLIGLAVACSIFALKQIAYDHQIYIQTFGSIEKGFWLA